MDIIKVRMMKQMESIVGEVGLLNSSKLTLWIVEFKQVNFILDRYNLYNKL